MSMYEGTCESFGGKESALNERMEPNAICTYLTLRSCVIISCGTHEKWGTCMLDDVTRLHALSDEIDL